MVLKVFRLAFLSLGCAALAAAQHSHQAAKAAAQPPGHADAAFAKLKSLVGDWNGSDEKSHAVKTNFKLMVADTVLMETLTIVNMDDMVTLYSKDRNGIALLHYCPTGNQPHMRAVPGAGEIKQLSFSFQGAGNLPDLAMGHEKSLTIIFDDADHITEHWTWEQKGKDVEMIYHFARTKTPSP